MKARTTSPDRRTRIIDAAVELFRDTHHVRKVSIEEIAGKAHVSPTTVYHYFGTREALVAEVAKTLVRVLVDRSRQLLDSPMPLAGKLQAIAAVKIQVTSALGDEVITKMASQDPDLARFVDELFRTELTPLWRQFLAQGKAEGYIEQDLDEDVFLAYLDTLIAGFRSRPDLLQGWQKDRRILEQISRLVLYGFMRKEVDLFGKNRGEADNRA